MPKFMFTAVDAQGQIRKGQVEAESEAYARAAISGKGMTLREISPVREAPSPTVAYDPPPQIESMAPAVRATAVSRNVTGVFSEISIARVLLLVGLLLVLGARGCDSIGARSAARARAEVDSEQTRFTREWQRKITDAKDNAEKTKVRQDMDKDRKDREEHAWKSLREDQEDAAVSNQLWGYWREMVFVAGTLILAAGAIWGAFTGTSAERIFCMIIAAVITFSLYIGGMAWISSVGSAAGLK